MKSYIVKSLKYFLLLCVLYAALMAVLYATNSAAVPIEELGNYLLFTTRGRVMIIVTLLLAALYPRFGFVEREIEGNITDDRERIVNVMRQYGMVLGSDSDGRMVFRAVGFSRRLRMLFEDRITITESNQRVRITGLRRVAVGAAFAIERAIHSSKLE